MSLLAILRDGSDGRWLRFERPLETVVARTPEEVLPGLEAVERGVRERGFHAAGFLSYEAAPAFDRAMRVRPPGAGPPLLLFGLYSEPQRLDGLPKGTPDEAAGDWSASLSPHEHEHALIRIKRHLARGDSYQVNFTHHLRAPFHGAPWSLFLAMQRAQQARYGAYLEAGGFAVCSASPELFFELDGELITCRPMKGTAARGHELSSDRRQMERLRASEKNRAENLMIVDMVRNDLGRIAEVGSVRVRSLFDVERLPTVLQMTSTIEARTRSSLVEIMTALFPSASITGAPKLRSMEIISELEPAARGIYTGAIGFAAPDRRAQFNVAIRTAVVDISGGRAEYGIGGGIVWDSEAAAEYRECGIKARIITEAPPEFDLLETMLWRPGEGYLLLDRHLERLAAAAAYFLRPVDAESVRRVLRDLAGRLPARPHRVRLLVRPDGELATEATPLMTGNTPPPVRVGLAKAPVEPRDPFLHHKTTHRAVYRDALDGRPDCEDVLLWNGSGEVTESTRANIVARIDGELVTPPASCGLLAGTFRAELLSRGTVGERVITVAELEKVEELHLVNSVQQWMDVVFVG